MRENGNTGQSSVKFKTLVTNIGKKKIAQAALHGEKVDIETAVITDGGGAYFLPDESMTELPGEVWRGPIKRKQINTTTPNIIDVTVFVDGTVGGWTARGIGLLDSRGDLIAVGNMPDTVKAMIVDGVAATMTICMKLAVSNVDVLEFKIDPSGLVVNEKQLYDALEIEQNAILYKLECAIAQHNADQTAHGRYVIAERRRAADKPDYGMGGGVDGAVLRVGAPAGAAGVTAIVNGMEYDALNMSVDSENVPDASLIIQKA